MRLDGQKTDAYAMLRVQPRCRPSAKRGGEQAKVNETAKRAKAQQSQGGQGMVEYALILVLVSIVVIVILLTMGGQIKNVFSNVVSALNS